jgi:hypothetical protein
LIVHHVERPFSNPTTRVLLEHQIADGRELVGVQHRARGIERRVEREQPRAANHRPQHLGARQESRRRIALDDHRLRADELTVRIVVPRRNREHHTIAGIDERAIGRIDGGSCARRDEDRRQRKLKAEPSRVEFADGDAQCLESVRRRVGRFAGPQRVDDPVLELSRDTELFRAEIADREIDDLLPLRFQCANVGGDLENGRAVDVVREARQTW